MAAGSVKIDSEKLKDWIAKQRENAESMSLELGYTRKAIGLSMRRGDMTRPMLRAMQIRYGLKLEDVIDELPEPAAKAEPETTGHDCAANAQAMELLAKAADEEQRMLGELDRRIKSCTEKLGVLEDLANNITAGFHVQTTPRIVTEDIAIGVCDGVSRWWSKNKEDIIKQVRGAMCAAYIDALQKKWGK